MRDIVDKSTKEDFQNGASEEHVKVFNAGIRYGIEAFAAQSLSGKAELTDQRVKAALKELSFGHFSPAEPEVGIMEDGFHLGGLTDSTMDTIKQSLTERDKMLECIRDLEGWIDPDEYAGDPHVLIKHADTIQQARTKPNE